MERCLNNYYLFNENIEPAEKFKSPVGGRQIYEVIRIIDGVPLFLEDHMERLIKSLELENLNSKYTVNVISDSMIKLIEANNSVQGNIKLILNFHENKEDLYIFYIPHSYPKEIMYSKGVNTILYHGERNNPNAKVINSSFRDNVNKKLEETNTYEAILVDKQGRITEGSRSNIFFVKGKKLVTSPVEAVLPGITRQHIIALCLKYNIEVEETYVKEEDIQNYNAAFISGTSPKVLPIKEVNSIIFNSSLNIIVKEIMKHYDNSIKEYINNYKLNKNISN